MEVDIRIYLQKLKDFFKTDKEAFTDMFGHGEVDMEEFYKMVTDKATINLKKKGDPILSTNEMLEIITDLALKDISKEVNIKEFAEDISERTRYEVLIFPDEKETSIKIVSICNSETQNIEDIKEYVYKKYEGYKDGNGPFNTIKDRIDNSKNEK